MALIKNSVRIISHTLSNGRPTGPPSQAAHENKPEKVSNNRVFDVKTDVFFLS